MSYIIKECVYRGVPFDFTGDTKADMTEALAGIDYLLTRRNAHEADAKTAPAPDTKAGEKPEKVKVEAKADAEPARKATTKKAAAKKAEPAEEPVKEEKQAEAAPAEEPETAATTEESAAEPEAAPGREITLDELRQQVMAYAQKNGNVKGKQLIEQFGGKKISDLPVEKYAEVFAAAGGEL